MLLHEFFNITGLVKMQCGKLHCQKFILIPFAYKIRVLELRRVGGRRALDFIGKEFQSEISGNEVHCTNALPLLIQIMLYSKLR